MLRVVLLSIFAFGIISCQQKISHVNTIYSEKVKDSFEIYISVPPSSDTNTIYDVIYYCDANLRSGNLMREMSTRDKYAAKLKNTIFVGIGHVGDYHVLRRRDFILPSINDGDTSGRSGKYGQTENFYQFLKTELIPLINSRYKTTAGSNSIIGHSLGGLFVFYCLFKNDSLFSNYYSLSPSLWIDHYSIYKFNRLKDGIMLPKNLYFSAGSLELLNRIKNGTNEMEKFLQTENYRNLKYAYDVHKGKNHNSQVEQSLDHIFMNRH